LKKRSITGGQSRKRGGKEKIVNVNRMGKQKKRAAKKRWREIDFNTIRNTIVSGKKTVRSVPKQHLDEDSKLKGDWSREKKLGSSRGCGVRLGSPESERAIIDGKAKKEERPGGTSND